MDKLVSWKFSYW